MKSAISNCCDATLQLKLQLELKLLCYRLLQLQTEVCHNIDTGQNCGQEICQLSQTHLAKDLF